MIGVYICESCRSCLAEVNYCIPGKVAPGRQTEWNFCRDCMQVIWAEACKSPTSESYLSAQFSYPRQHDWVDDVFGMS